MEDKIVVTMRFEFPREFADAVAEHLGKKKAGREDIRHLIRSLVDTWATDMAHEPNEGGDSFNV
jgi:hypothetical protein